MGLCVSLLRRPFARGQQARGLNLAITSLQCRWKVPGVLPACLPGVPACPIACPSACPSGLETPTEGKQSSTVDL